MNLKKLLGPAKKNVTPATAEAQPSDDKRGQLQKLQLLKRLRVNEKAHAAMLMPHYKPVDYKHASKYFDRCVDAKSFLGTVALCSAQIMQDALTMARKAHAFNPAAVKENDELMQKTLLLVTNKKISKAGFSGVDKQTASALARALIHSLHFSARKDKVEYTPQVDQQDVDVPQHKKRGVMRRFIDKSKDNLLVEAKIASSKLALKHARKPPAVP